MKSSGSSQPPKNKTIDKKLISVTLASFWKKLIAWVYDLLGAIAIFILALFVGYILIYVISLPWADNGESVSLSLSGNPFWSIYLIACVQYYYVWCWVKGGQTVGMRTWNLKVCNEDGSLLSWKQAYLRSFYSLAGISLLWSLFDKQSRGLHDIMSNSCVVQLPKGHNKVKHTKPLI